MNNLMIDIETLSKNPDAAILSIGAVFFDTETLELGETIHFHIKMESSLMYGHIEPETVKWWILQSQEAREDVTSGESVTLLGALISLDAWIKFHSPDIDNLKVWSKSPCFDLVILKSAFQRFQKEVPWKYYNERDVRTALDIGETLLDTKTDHRKQFEGKHTALHDALFQASLIIDVYDQK